MSTGTDEVRWNDPDFLPFYFFCIASGLFLPIELSMIILIHIVLFGMMLFIPSWYKFNLFVYTIAIVYTALILWNK